MKKRLERIIIEGLFDRFNYNIDLNNGESVAILSAPNGCGKTTIFNIVDFIFMPSFEKFRKINNYPFSSCSCILSNGKTVKLRVVEKELSEEEKRKAEILRRNMARNGVGNLGYRRFYTKNIFIDIISDEKKKPESVNITDMLQNLMDRAAHGIDLDAEIDDIAFADIHPRDRMMYQRNVLFASQIKNLLSKYDCDLTIKFIQADRLHNPVNQTDMRSRYRGSEYVGDNLDPLEDACKEIRDKYYMELRDKYHALQSEASDLLPKRYLSAKKSKVPMDEFKKRWDSYIGDIRKFYEIGMLDSDETILSEDELEEAYEGKREFLNVYLESFEKTLEPLRCEYDRMKLFTDILNKRNKGTLKEMKYGKNGIEISVAGKPLDISCLSSGEKHDFIMFYNLIFKAEKGSIVFVDEPEISLHINWQEEYIDRLLEICKINDLQAFVATHSPNIVNEHFDLMVERGAHDGSR